MILEQVNTKDTSAIVHKTNTSSKVKSVYIPADWKILLE